jgi:prephenate dehydratase
LINKEIVIDIHHSISSLNKGIKTKNIAVIFSHPQALGQCKHYLHKHFPNATLVPTASTSAGQKKIKEERLADALAIGPSFAARINGLKILAENIEDEKNNQTMFVAVSKTAVKKSPSMKSTLLGLVLKTDKEGILHDILSVFKDRKINLSKIESRPSRKKLGLYMFYVKIDIARKDKRMPEVIRELERMGITVTLMSA